MEPFEVSKEVGNVRNNCPELEMRLSCFLLRAKLSTIAAFALVVGSLPVAQGLSPSPAIKPVSPVAATAPVMGVVADSSEAIIPGAEIDLLDATGAVVATSHSMSRVIFISRRQGWGRTRSSSPRWALML